MIIIFLLAALCAAFVYYARRTYMSKSRETVFKEAAKLQSEGTPDRAENVLERHLEDRFSESAFVALIHIILASGKYDKAIELFKKTERRKKNTMNSYLLWGYTHYLKGDYEAAQKIYEETMKKYPDNGDFIEFNVASLYIEAADTAKRPYDGADLEEAERILNRLLDSDKIKNKYNLYVNLGMAQSKLGKFEEAIYNERIALELIPKEDRNSSLFALAHYIAGLSLYNLNRADVKKAKEELEIAKRYTRNEDFLKKIQNALDTIGPSL